MFTSTRGRVQGLRLKRSSVNLNAATSQYRYQCRCFSSLHKAVLDSKQGDTLIVNCRVPSAKINITSSWQEHCDVEYSRGIQVDMTARERSCNSTVYTLFLHHDVDKSKSAETPVLNVTLPEMFHVTVKADDTSLNFRRKIMGDVYVDCNSGDVCIDQLRGENIHLHCNSASLEVKKKLEGSLSVSCQSLTAQMLHGNSVDISADKDVSVKALYAVNSSIQSAAGSVKVGLSHGHSVISSSASCSLSGVDGSFVVKNMHGGATVQINKLYPGSESMVVSKHGSVSAHVDPEVVTKLYCSTRDEDSIVVDSDGFKVESSTDTSCQGLFSGQSSAVKRPLRSSRKFSRKSGKINVESAELLSLRNTTKAEALSSDSSQLTDQLPSLSLIAKSSVLVESVSWIGNIMKKYDL